MEPMPRLAQALGLRPDDLWIKRDDLTGLAGGGLLSSRCCGTVAGPSTNFVSTIAKSGRAMRPLPARLDTRLSSRPRTEGIALDPTYTGRALAGLIASARSGAIAPGGVTVFVHTGGLPGLFGHDWSSGTTTAA